VPGNTSTDELIRRVAKGEIEYTVADKNIAQINKTYHSNIDIRTDISFPQRLAWAVRKNSPKLLETVNDWIMDMRKGSDYYVIYNKYFKNRKLQTQR
ncbi:MAG: lytic transglycosylase F, partial [Flavobacteriales bacterium]